MMVEVEVRRKASKHNQVFDQSPTCLLLTQHLDYM